MGKQGIRHNNLIKAMDIMMCFQSTTSYKDFNTMVNAQQDSSHTTIVKGVTVVFMYSSSYGFNNQVHGERLIQDTTQTQSPRVNYSPLMEENVVDVLVKEERRLWRRRPLRMVAAPWPPFFLGHSAGVGDAFPLLGSCQEEEISWLWLPVII
jgi:hypothetical protein